MPCSLSVNRGSPIRGHNLSVELVPAVAKPQEYVLDLPSEKDVIPVDDILYDLVEGMTSTAVSVLNSRKR